MASGWDRGRSSERDAVFARQSSGRVEAKGVGATWGTIREGAIGAFALEGVVHEDLHCGDEKSRGGTKSIQIERAIFLLKLKEV